MNAGHGGQRNRWTEIRHEFAWLESGSTVVLTVGAESWNGGHLRGTRANATLARALSDATRSRVEHDGFSLTFESRLSLDDIQQAIKEVRSAETPRPFARSSMKDAIEGLKFSECLPDHLAVEMLERRLVDIEATKKTLEQAEDRQMLPKLRRNRVRPLHSTGFVESV